MQLHSLIVSEPAGVLSGFGVGVVTYYAAHLCGLDPHLSLMAGCVAHFVTNTVVAGHINLFLLDFLALALRLPLAAGSAFWMDHVIATSAIFH